MATGIPRRIIGHGLFTFATLSLYFQLFIHASFAGAPCGPYTVTLHRQQIPLHSEGGVVHHKSAYYGEITVGGPSTQTFDVVFDTGSGHLVLPSAVCRSETCRAHRRYRRRASLLAEDIDVDGTPVNPWQARDQITVSFGTGDVTGIFVKDYVCLGPPDVTTAPQKDPRAVEGSSLLQRKVPKISETVLPAEDTQEDNIGGIITEVIEVQDIDHRPRRHGCTDLRIVSATHMSEDPFSSFTFDGVLGLGLKSLSQTPEFNFQETGANNGAWAGGDPSLMKLFSVFLSTSDAEQSDITFGGWKEDHMAPGDEFVWSTVQDPHDGYWQIEVKEIRIDGMKLDYCDGDIQCRAVVDTGTSLIAVPSDLGPLLVDRLRHVASGLEGGCDGAGPKLEIDFGNITLTLDPVDYARPEFIAEVGEDDDHLPSDGDIPVSSGEDSALEEDEEKTCVPMLMHIDLPSPLSPKTLILGEPVLQRYYTAFDSSVPRVGFTQAVHSAPKVANGVASVV